MKYFNISDADAAQISAESPTFRKYRFQAIANAIVDDVSMRDNVVRAIKMYRSVVSAIDETPALVDCKNIIQAAIANRAKQIPF